MALNEMAAVSREGLPDATPNLTVPMAAER
jgi:hypothetical protein